MNIKYCECVSVALVIQHAMRMRRVVLSSVACWLYHIFPHYHIKGTIFGKNVAEHKVYILISFTTFVRHISYSKKKSAIHYCKSK
jgi:hypothetical protein